MESLASKFTVSPTFMLAVSAEMLALGLPGPSPLHPVSIWHSSRVAITAAALRGPMFIAISTKRSLIGMLGAGWRHAHVEIVDGRCRVGRGMAVGMLSGYRVLGFDLETTGFNPRSDRVVQFALVGSDVDGSHINLQSLVNPGISIPEETVRVHGITNDDVRGQGGFGDHIAEMASLMEGSIIVGHNIINFDWRFVNMECMRIGVEVPRPHAIIDTLLIARRFAIPGSHRLGRLCNRFNIRLDRSHRADTDAGATLLLLWKMMQTYPRKFRGTVDEFVDSLTR